MFQTRRQLNGLGVTPEVQEEQTRLLLAEVVMESCDLDTVPSERIQNRRHLRPNQNEIARGDGLAATVGCMLITVARPMEGGTTIPASLTVSRLGIEY